MQAKFIFEAIKHLKPRTKKEVDAYYKSLTPNQKLSEGSKIGDIQLVKTALKEGVYINSNEGDALFYAALHRHVDIVKLLLDNGADVNAYIEILAAAVTEDEGGEKGSFEITKMLLDAGANEKSIDRAFYYTKQPIIFELLKQYRTKRVNESIKHLKPRSKEELEKIYREEEYHAIKVYKHYEHWRKHVQEVESIAELLDVMTVNYPTEVARENQKILFKRYFNQKFKGNLDKSKDWCIREINTYEENYLGDF
jgi:hypothetical protein